LHPEINKSILEKKCNDLFSSNQKIKDKLKSIESITKERWENIDIIISKFYKLIYLLIISQMVMMAMLILK
jgi:hypothetical protein